MEYHVLTSRDSDDGVDVIFHIPVPDVNNAVSVNYRTSVQQFESSKFEDGVIKSQLPWITAPELAQIQAGEIIEVRVSVEYSKNISNSEKLAAIEAKFTAEQANLLTERQTLLKYWGKEGDIV